MAAERDAPIALAAHFRLRGYDPSPRGKQATTSTGSHLKFIKRLFGHGVVSDAGPHFGVEGGVRATQDFG